MGGIVELIQAHNRPGPGPVRIEAPDLPVEITVHPDTEYRMAHVVADRGLGAHAGPGGPEGQEMRIFVGRPGTASWIADLLAWITDLFGRQGSLASDDSVTAAGEGSIASGGSIGFAATGNGAQVTVNGKPVQRKNPGVHLTVPPGCTFDIRKHNGVTVHYNGTEMTVETAAEIGILERA